MKDSVAILGGGLAGLTLGSLLHNKNIPFRIYEKDELAGGIARTEHLDAFKYDMGAHRFHNRDPKLTRWVTELLQGSIIEVNKKSAISRFGTLIDFPLSPLNLITQAPLSKSLIYSLSWITRRTDKQDNLKDFAISRFGKALAQDFILDYSHKLWGKPPEELSLELGSARLKQLDFPTLIKEIIHNKRANNRHIDGQFLYPIGGFGEIPRQLSSLFDRDQLYVNNTILSIKEHGRYFDVTTQQGMFKHKYLVNTLPLDKFATLYDNVTHFPHELFQYRHLMAVFLTLNQRQISPHVSLYFPEPSHTFTRAHEPRNRWQGMSPQGKTSVLLEIPMSEPWKASPQIADQAIEEFCNTGLIEKNSILNRKEFWAPYAYPIITNSCTAPRAAFLKSLESNNKVFCLGRNARFSYLHCHDIYKESLELCQKIENTYHISKSTSSLEQHTYNIHN